VPKNLVFLLENVSKQKRADKRGLIYNSGWLPNMQEEEQLTKITLNNTALKQNTFSFKLAPSLSYGKIILKSQRIVFRRSNFLCESR